MTSIPQELLETMVEMVRKINDSLFRDGSKNYSPLIYPNLKTERGHQMSVFLF